VSVFSKSDEEIGDYLMYELEKAYGKSPVLISWDWKDCHTLSSYSNGFCSRCTGR